MESDVQASSRTTAFFQTLLTLIICSDIPVAKRYPDDSPVPPYIHYDVLHGYTLFVTTPTETAQYRLEESDLLRSPAALLEQIRADLLVKERKTK